MHADVYKMVYTDYEFTVEIDTGSETRHISCWQDTIYPQYCPCTSAPGGIIPSRLDWLCQPEQVERTLHLLFHLNHWAKAREHLWYDDRQGLYKVKAVVLQHAYKCGAVSPITYIDGSESFGCNYSLDMAVDIATEAFVERLEMSFDGTNQIMDELDLAAHRIFAHIIGYEAKTKADCEALDEVRAKSFIGQSLKRLVNQARSTRQPIPSQELAALFISPTDLLEVHLSRNRHFPTWDELEESEVRQLDPEGLSLVAFQYSSSTARYVFHLPFRIAEQFLPEQLVRELRSHASTSREAGTFYGRAITEAESYKFPLVDLLHELLVDISSICPHGLVRKVQYLHSSQAWSTANWDEDAVYDGD